MYHWTRKLVMKTSRLTCLRYFNSIKRPKYILGIETSCDDTAAAIIDDQGHVLSEQVSSQWDLHAEYKGVYPNMASRAHIKNLPMVINKTLQQSGLNSFRDLDAVAVTTGPGLAPCLLAGLKYAKTLVQTHEIPSFLSINHLEAHLLVPMMTVSGRLD